MQLKAHSYDLIDELDKQYPEVIYSHTVDREEFLMRSGERRLVLMLKRMREYELDQSNDPAFRKRGKNREDND